MKTITQYREELVMLDKAMTDIDNKCIAENREMSATEMSVKNEVMDKMEETKGKVSILERQEKLRGELAAPGTSVTRGADYANQRREKDNFRSFGEQLSAVIKACSPGGSVDRRLIQTRDVSGMSEGVPSDGGFLVQQDFSNEILQDTFQTGILASRCRRIPISGNSNSLKLNGVDETSRASSRYGGIVGYWGAEAAEKTKSKPKFREIDLSLKKLVGLCYATDELLMDSAALEGVIREGFASEFGFLIDDAIINGTGAGQPLGILNAGCLVTVAKESGQTDYTVLAQNVINMYSRLFAQSRANAVWLINQNVEPQLFTMTIPAGNSGIPVYLPPGGMSNTPYGSLLGRPVIPIEQASSLGAVGDIIFADLTKGYILGEKGGIQSDMSIHVRFVYDESVFRFVLRIDGQPVRATALTPYKGGANYTQSHFIVLEEREA